MVILSGYRDLSQIHEGDNSRVYRARRIEDGQFVVLKALREEYPTPEQIKRYKQEYQLTHQLQLSHVVKAYSLEEWQRTLIITLEDFGGHSLKYWLNYYPQGLPIAEFLPLALEIITGLEQLHQQAIIHKDINPSNIVWNRELQIVKLIDLGISTQLSLENPTLANPSTLEGTLPYLSPEQTGRMNRILDYRTDFYSLGATFYELLTGQLPFASSDPINLVYCHIAKQPIPPHLLKPIDESNQALEDANIILPNSAVPASLSNIVMKLMSKNAEDRYQSARGLKEDLQICWQQWQSKRAIAPFPLGRNDISNHLQISQKLYGREQEVAVLLEAFQKIAGKIEFLESAQEGAEETNKLIIKPESRVEFLLVSGYSGVGKSVLVQELYKPITARHGYFISGKFDQFQRNIPYSAVVHAFTNLVRQILGEPEQKLNRWRERLKKSLGNNGQLVIDVIPELELIIGSQPPVSAWEPHESQNKFNLVFQRFIRACCTIEHPLTIFLDDLQWADLATIHLIERLISDREIEYLLLIGAYRDNEVRSGDPLNLTLEQLRRQGHALEQIVLAPLQLEHITQLLTDALPNTSLSVQDLAELVMYKTAGNPFFTIELLKNLHSEKLVEFNRTTGEWQWDLAKVKAVGFTDNVADLMIGKLQRLPPDIQETLSLAACLGTEFDLDTLALLRNHNTHVVFRALKIAIDKGFLLPRSPLDESLLIPILRTKLVSNRAIRTKVWEIGVRFNQVRVKF